MSKSTLISFALCTAGAVALFGWLFASAPLQPVASVKTAGSGVPATKTQEEKKLGPQGSQGSQGPVVFAVPKSKATALNNEPVNIIIDPVTETIPVNTGNAVAGPADLVVTSSGLRMRSEPSSQSLTLANYAKGARFSHIRDENGWSLVQSLDDGQKGWMFRKFMGDAS